MADAAEAQDLQPADATVGPQAMAGQGVTDPTAAPGGKPSSRSGRKVVVLALAGGVALGGALGGFVVGPKLVRARAGHPAAGISAAEAHPAAGKAHRKPGFVLEYDNLIINPSGAEGSHFLMATVGLELPDAKSSQELEERDLQVRDLIISVLSSQTMESLSAPNARDVVKQQLAEEIAPLAGNPAWIEVYLPQFVIQ